MILFNACPICKSPLAYGGPSCSTNRGPFAFFHYFRQDISPDYHRIQSVHTCQSYSSLDVLCCMTLSLAGSPLIGKRVWGRCTVSRKELLPDSQRRPPPAKKRRSERFEPSILATAVPQRRVSSRLRQQRLSREQEVRTRFRER